MRDKFKGTKGEWKVSKEDTFRRKMIDLADFKGSIDVWYHSGDTMTKEEADCNAKLIANAPELLNGCIHALEMYQEKVMPTENDLTIMAERLKSIINKALT